MREMLDARNTRERGQIGWYLWPDGDHPDLRWGGEYRRK